MADQFKQIHFDNSLVAVQLAEKSVDSQLFAIF